MILISEPKSVKFNEEVDVKTIEPVPEVLEIDEVHNIFLFFLLIVYSLLNIHQDLPVLFCIFFRLLGHILCRGLPNALFSFAAPWTRTQTVVLISIKS